MTCLIKMLATYERKIRIPVMTDYTPLQRKDEIRSDGTFFTSSCKVDLRKPWFDNLGGGAILTMFPLAIHAT